jgi:hypothetical protein
MAESSRNYAQATKVLEIVQALASSSSFYGFTSGDVRLVDNYEDYLPERGIFIQMAEETEGTGVNERDDVRYAVQVIFSIARTASGIADRIQRKSEFRRAIYKRFNRQRIGVDTGACEIVTRARFGTIKVPKRWIKDVDVSVMVVTTLVRESRYSA